MRHRTRQFVRLLRQPQRYAGPLAAGALWHVSAATGWAQEAAGSESPAEKSYVLPYALVVMLVLLGCLLVLRPVNRSKEVRKKPTE